MKLLIACFALFLCAITTVRGDLRAGAAVIDTSPPDLDRFPVLVNGGMRSRTANVVQDPINARALVLDDGAMQIALVVVDSCMMPRPLLDKAKALASEKTGIPADRMMVSATHTHTAPASMGCLGTNADLRYSSHLIKKIAEAIETAQAKLEPAQIGWSTQDAAEFTAVRRWVRRTDRPDVDPFGNPTVRATMHAGRIWDNVTGESGPEDPELALISIQRRDGSPLALLANFSMHYFGGVKPLSADYFGRFAANLKAALAPDGDFVGIMSHGCSGDIWRRDYTTRDHSKDGKDVPRDITVDEFALGMAERALTGYDAIEHRADLDLAMAEHRMTLDYRVPDEQRLEWARRIAAKLEGRAPMEKPEIYALEQLILHERQRTEIVLQGIRIGDIAIATTPNETYALTGLKLKAMSPFQRTMVIELANGGDGYIPPPEQHVLGGYNCWPARSAGLEVPAEPKIVEADLQLLEKVTALPRREPTPSRGPAARALLDAKPVAYWRLDEFALPRAVDASGNHRHGAFEDGVVFHLEGARSDIFNENGEVNRAAHFCGGRMTARLDDLGTDYSVSLWFWNGMPDGARDIAGWMFSRGPRDGLAPAGDHLGLRGDGKLVFQSGDGEATAGGKAIARWTWNHALLVRKGDRVRVYLNGAAKPEIDAEVTPGAAAHLREVFVGGRCDGVDGWEGRLDEVAVFDRAVHVAELSLD